VAYLRGPIHVGFENSSHWNELIAIAPSVNYFGKRGSFFQFERLEQRDSLDETYTRGLLEGGQLPARCHLATLDDFGPEADFNALNSFSDTSMKRGRHRIWTESIVPLGIGNAGPGFVHYRR